MQRLPSLWQGWPRHIGLFRGAYRLSDGVLPERGLLRPSWEPRCWKAGTTLCGTKQFGPGRFHLRLSNKGTQRQPVVHVPGLCDPPSPGWDRPGV